MRVYLFTFFQKEKLVTSFSQNLKKCTQKRIRYFSLSFGDEIELFIPVNCYSFIFSGTFNDMHIHTLIS